MKHAKLSASGSSRWLNCPGSVKAEEGYPFQGSSEFAEEGSMAHELAEKCLIEELDAEDFLGKEVYKRIVQHDMLAPVQEYVDYVRSYIGWNTDLLVETRVRFNSVVPNGFGTLDAAVVDRENKVCHIFDLKYGKGVKVDAFENSQAMLYAIGMFPVLKDTGIDKFVIHIVQPRIYNFSSWEISVKDLKKFGLTVREKAELALSGHAPRVPGDKQCQWCRAKGDCKVLATYTEDLITSTFYNLDEVDPDTLTNEEKKAILDNKKLIESFVKAVEASVFTDLELGKDFEGYKLVEGRSMRKWKVNAEEALVDQLGDEAYNKKIIGVGEAEKRLGKDFIDDLTIKPVGKTTLAPSSDKRKPIENEAIEDQFENIEK